MKQRFQFLAKYSFIWLAFFIFIKLIFLFVNHNLSFVLIKLWPKILVHGLLMDFSMLGYVIAMPLFLLIVHTFLSGRWFYIVCQTYTVLLLIIFSFIVIADLVIYPEWGFRLDVAPLFYLKTPEGAMASITSMEMVLYFLFSLLIPIPFIYLFRRTNKQTVTLGKNQKWIAAPALLLTFGLLIIPIRGGVSASTMNTGNAYFSENTFANHAALNVFWNIFYSFANKDDYSNPFVSKIENPIALEKGGNCLVDSSNSILTNKTPNIILIVLESFSARLMESVSPDFKIARNLDSLARNGVFFSNIYASGDRSDKGLVSILSGYPSQPTTSIIKYPNKTEKLPGLAKTLAQSGYASTFYYGGDINFASMKSYFVNCGFQELVHILDFKPSQRISSWGVPDEYVFERLYSDIQKENSPYFKTIFTLSSHTPYDVPQEKKWVDGTDDESLFLNSAAYTDYQLGRFIKKLESNGLLENTLVVLVADHGSMMPGPAKYASKEMFHIPLVLYGPELKEKGLVINKTASQADIPATLLGLLEINSSEYLFSRNIMCPQSEENACFAISRGFGYVSDQEFIRYNMDNDKFSVLKGNLSDTLEIKTKSFYYNLYENFLGLN